MARINKIQKYGMEWNATTNPVAMEIYAIRQGGKWKNKKGEECGLGLCQHYKNLQSLIMPDKKWHKWNELLLFEFCKNRITAILGPASSGKTREASDYALSKYICFPECTSVLISSTDMRSLELRVWGEIKKNWAQAKRLYPETPGNIIGSKQMIATDSVDDVARDFRNGIIGIPCFPTGTLVDTPEGSKEINSIKIGDRVLNAFGDGIVTKIHKRTFPFLIRVTLSDGRKIDSTPDHPFFTDRGWINGIDLKTSDIVFSQHETVSMLQQSDTWLSEPEVLQSLQRFSSRAEMHTMQQIVSTNQNKQVEQLQGTVLQQEVLVDCGFKSNFKEEVSESLLYVPKALFGSHEPEILLNKVQEQTREISMLYVRRDVYLNSGKSVSSKIPILLAILQEESCWKEKFSEEGSPNKGGDDRLESVSRCNPSLQPENRTNNVGWETPLVRNRLSFSGHKASNRSGRRNTQHSQKGSERCNQNQKITGTRVESVEILEYRGDSRFCESERGYPVYNIEVSGHPTYSVNGVIVHNCLVGGSFVGLGKYVGIKNKNVILLADELQFMNRAFCDSISNLNKNEGFQCLGLGNPKERLDALGIMAEPSDSYGGWDSVDDIEKTKVWPTRMEGGVCVQLVGTDSPNFDVPESDPVPYPFLISRKSIASDIQFYGRDSLQFSMMNLGMMPKSSVSRRVITRSLCLQFSAMEEPIWQGSSIKKILGLDAAYGNVGGDRCMATEIHMGTDVRGKRIVAIKPSWIIPVTSKSDKIPEDQIAEYVKKECESRGIPPENVGYDSTGKGSLGTSFARIWSSAVNPIEFGGKPTDRPVGNNPKIKCRDYYSKFVSELWYAVRYTIEADQLRGMTESLLNEGALREWTIVSGNRIEIEPKHKTKERMGRSPDEFDSLVCAVEMARRLGFVIDKFSNIAEDEDKYTWFHDLKQQNKDLNRKNTLVFN